MGGSRPTDELALVEAHLRRLDDEACAAFVADLWAARGYETTRDGTQVTASRSDNSLTIRVGGGSGDIVIARGRRGQAVEGARVIDAEGLAERLWYAVDRSVAHDLCERHLGGSPGTLRLPLGTRLQRRVGRVRPGTISAVVVVVVVAVALVALGGAGPTGEGATPANATATATPVTAADGGQVFPPGVSAAGIRDIDALAAAHLQAVDERPATIWVDKQFPTYTDEGRIRSYDMDVTSNGEQYLVDISLGPRDNRTDVGALYHDGQNSFARIVDDGNVSYQVVSPPQQEQSLVPSPSGLAARLVTRYLSTPTTELTGQVTRDGETYYRIVATGDPGSPSLGSVTNYTATADVTASGFVQNLTVTYTETSGDQRYRLTREVTYGRLDETTVRVPEWYRERFDDDITPTA
jgi:hypothetical protein